MLLQTTVQWMHSMGDIVTDTFNYTVSDGQGETDIATITNNYWSNDAPTAVADTIHYTVVCN